MAKTGQDDTMYVGNKRTFRYTVVDEDVVGEPALDLTPFATNPADIKWTLSQISPDGVILKDSPVVEKKRTTGGVTITDAPNGVCEVDVVGADTAALQAGSYHTELELFDAFGESVVVAKGTQTLAVNVTNT